MHIYNGTNTWKIKHFKLLAIWYGAHKVPKYIKTKIDIYLVNIYFSFLKQTVCGQWNFTYSDNQRQI